jgi:hypothetical protein
MPVVFLTRERSKPKMNDVWTGFVPRRLHRAWPRWATLNSAFAFLDLGAGDARTRGTIGVRNGRIKRHLAGERR